MQRHANALCTHRLAKQRREEQDEEWAEGGRAQEIRVNLTWLFLFGSWTCALHEQTYSGLTSRSIYQQQWHNQIILHCLITLCNPIRGQVSLDFEMLNYFSTHFGAGASSKRRFAKEEREARYVWKTGGHVLTGLWLKEERALARWNTGDEKYQTRVQTFINHHLHGYILD